MSDSVKSTIDQVAVAIAEKRFEDAIRSCEAQLEKTPGDVLVLCKLGDAALRSGDAKRSEQVCREAIAKDPEYGWARYGLGVALSRQRQHADALEQFTLAQGCSKGIVPSETIDRAISAEKRKQKPSGAGLSRTPSERSELNEIVQGASKLLASGSIAEAIKLLEDAIKNGQASAVIHTRLGDARLRNKDIRGAETAYMTAIDIDPEFPWGHYGLANVLGKQLKWKQSEACYAKAQLLAPDNDLFIRGHQDATKTRLLEDANALIDSSEFEEAASLLRKLVAMDPEHPVAAERLRAAIHLANTDETAGEEEVNTQYYRRELEAFSQYLDALERELPARS